MCKLLTNLNLYFFDSQRIINKLSQSFSLKSSFFDVIFISVISFSKSFEKTSINQKKISVMMNYFTSWLFSFFQNNIKQLKKTSLIAFANRLLLQSFIIALFKINLTKKEKMKKRKDKKERVTYENTFERMLIQIMIEFQRVKKEQKIQKISIKKQASQRREINVVIKKQMMIDNKIKRAAARAIKKTKRIDWKH